MKKLMFEAIEVFLIIVRNSKRVTAVTTVILSVILLMSCDEPESLAPVSGVKGILRFTNSWPDSVKGGAIIVLDSLDLVHTADHIITFSSPIPSNIDSASYFIQLPPGSYAAVFVGLLVEPALIATKLDSILEAPSLPIMVPPGLPRGMLIKEDQVSEYPDWLVGF